MYVKGDLWLKSRRCTFSRLYLELSGKWICFYGLATTTVSKIPRSKGRDSEEQECQRQWLPENQESWWLRFYSGTITFPHGHVALMMLRT